MLDNSMNGVLDNFDDGLLDMKGLVWGDCEEGFHDFEVDRLG